MIMETVARFAQIKMTFEHIHNFFFSPFKMFCPQDYQHSLVFVTERERFEVPVYAIGPRAILDFRDEIHLPPCPVKYCTERTHLVRNIGNCTAKFMLQTQRWEPVPCFL